MLVNQLQQKYKVWDFLCLKKLLSLALREYLLTIHKSIEEIIFKKPIEQKQIFIKIIRIKELNNLVIWLAFGYFSIIFIISSSARFVPSPLSDLVMSCVFCVTFFCFVYFSQFIALSIYYLLIPVLKYLFFILVYKIR